MDSVKGLLVENTAANSGPKGGLVVELEEILGREVHTIGCGLHQECIFYNTPTGDKEPSIGFCNKYM